MQHTGNTAKFCLKNFKLYRLNIDINLCDTNNKRTNKIKIIRRHFGIVAIHLNTFNQI